MKRLTGRRCHIQDPLTQTQGVVHLSLASILICDVLEDQKHFRGFSRIRFSRLQVFVHPFGGLACEVEGPIDPGLLGELRIRPSYAEKDDPTFLGLGIDSAHVRIVRASETSPLVDTTVAYSSDINMVPLAFGLGFIAVSLVVRARGVRNGPLYFLIGVAAWVAFLKSGIDPIVVGLIFGLLTYAYSATRESLEQASEAFRQFREQPTAELAQSAREVVRTAISPNDRLAQLWHPWTSDVIVPTNTSPFATVGTANFTMAPTLSGRPVRAA